MNEYYVYDESSGYFASEESPCWYYSELRRAFTLNRARIFLRSRSYLTAAKIITRAEAEAILLARSL